jgi:hypothetical protein
LDEVKDIAFGGAMRIPPAATVVIDDHHLPWSAAIFQRAPGASPLVERPCRLPPLEECGAADPMAQLFKLGILTGHRTVLQTATGG